MRCYMSLSSPELWMRRHRHWLLGNGLSLYVFTRLSSDNSAAVSFQFTEKTCRQIFSKVPTFLRDVTDQMTNQNVPDRTEPFDRAGLWMCCCVWKAWELFGQFWTLAVLQLRFFFFFFLSFFFSFLRTASTIMSRAAYRQGWRWEEWYKKEISRLRNAY